MLPVHFLLRLADRVSLKPYSLLDGPSTSCLFSKSASVIPAVIVGAGELPCQPRSLTTHDACTTKNFCCFITFEIKTPEESS